MRSKEKGTPRLRSRYGGAFTKHVGEFPKLLERLRGMPPVDVALLPEQMPERAIYLWSEGSKALYVGRTNNLRNRVKAHSLPGSTHHSAAFAVLLTKAELERNGKKLSGITLKDLFNRKDVCRVFAEAKARVRSMDLRYVEVVDPITQTLFEVYTHLELGTPYNSFDNH